MLTKQNFSNFFKKDKVSKTLDFIEKNQKWWWYGIIVYVLIVVSFDIGQIVARGQMWGGSDSIKGNITINEAVYKSKNGGRLLITSKSDARFIDNQGFTWLIPDFAKKVNQENMDVFKENNVLVDGSFNINIRPVKVKSEDMIFTLIFDLATRLFIIFIYGLVGYFILKFFLGGKKSNYKKVKSDDNSIKIADVAGYDSIKKELTEVVDYLRHPEDYKKVGARPPRGVLLYGPPGTGKTLLAKAVAGEAAASFFEQSASSFVRIYAGAGAKAVQDLFDVARKAKPAVIFIDEIDAIGGSRANGGHDERIQTLNAILTEMDGFKNNDGIVVVAATNRIETLDEALVRPGRFDRKVYINLPTFSDREKILKIHASKIKIADDIDWSLWASQTKGFSGAELSALVNEAAIEAARFKKEKVENNDFILARDRVMMGVKNTGQVLSDKEKEIVSVHEIGHALLRIHTGGRVEKVSIEPRGQSLGVTVSVASDDKYLHTIDDIKNELLILMAGRASEKVMFNEVTGGAADDMSRASNLARDVVLRMGSETWGAYIPKTQDSKIEEEASKLVNEAYNQAQLILQKYKKELTELSEILKQKEELNEYEINAVLNINLIK